MTDCEPAFATLPAHPSPGEPPPAVHCAPGGALHDKIAAWSRNCVYVDDVNVKSAPATLAVCNVPVLPGSRTLLSVAVPVLLVVSAVEAQTAESEVKSATSLLPLGALGGLAGHI